jgi:hypothetical protein
MIHNDHAAYWFLLPQTRRLSITKGVSEGPFEDFVMD